MSTARDVAIFRLQLFKPSETFIPAQVRTIRRYSPVYVGRKLHGAPDESPVVVPTGSSWLARHTQHLGMQLLRSPASLIEGLVRTKPQVSLVHAHFGIDAVYALPLAKRLGVPLITTLHGFDVTRKDSSLLLSGRPALINGVMFRRQLQREGTLFLCVSNAIRKAALARGYSAEKLRLHYIGIDTSRITPRNGAGEPGLITHVGRLVEKKGTRYLLEAVARIRPAHPNLRLVIIGDGPLRTTLERQAMQLGIADCVNFLGARPNTEVLDWDRRASLKAVPSITGSDGDQEGLPTVITETMALGVPVVAFNSGGISEAVVHNETGLLCPERDIEGLATALACLLSDNGLRLRMGQAARRRAEVEFDIARQTAKLEAIYDDIVGVTA